MKRTIMKMACAACLVMTNATAYGEIPEERDDKLTEQAMQRFEMRGLVEDEEQHETVGSRALSHADEVAIEEERARMNNEESSPEKVDEKESKFLKKSLALSIKEDETAAPRPIYHTSHPGVFYHPIAMTALCDQVTLHDGSVWGVHYSDRYKLMGWLPSDTVVISVNDAWFSTYKFLITNQLTGDCVEVNMLQGPLYNGLSTHWIVAIDYYSQQVVLEDGSLWKISSSDYSVMKHWLVNDTVMIGINTSWFSSHPNILINVKMLNYTSATCQN